MGRRLRAPIPSGQWGVSRRLTWHHLIPHLQLINRRGQTLLTQLHIPPDIPITLVAGGLLGVLHAFLGTIATSPFLCCGKLDLLDIRFI